VRDLARPCEERAGSFKQPKPRQAPLVRQNKELLIQFTVGDFVVHPVYGLGHLVKIEERQFSEMQARLYYQITLPGCTVWIPVEAQATIGLRLVTADLGQYRDLLRSRPVPLHKDHRRRHLELVSRLNQGSFQMVCEVVRDLTAWGRQKPLNRTDTVTLKKTQESLYQEWATAAGISIAEAMKEIEFLLQTTQQVSLE
jgi:CarD family transcriptional regulator